MDPTHIIDLRSDTATLPTEEMLEAISKAKLGNDVFREDPTVNALEELAAEKMGKEDALLVTSGTQGNLVSLMSHTAMGDEVILEADSHIYYYEVGGISAIAGLISRPVKGTMGVLNPQDVEAVIRPKDIHQPETRLLCLENTHNRAGGTIVRPNEMAALKDVAHSFGLAVHLDGARIFNAAVALKVEVTKFTDHTDSVLFCLSKGLSAPVGSLVAGDTAVIEKARKYRKMLGGGMRQAGIIAAPGIIALEKMVQRLEEDHQNARFLAEELAKIDRIDVDLNTVQTNLVLFNIAKLNLSAKDFVELLEKEGVKTGAYGGSLVRMAVHRGISKEDIKYTLGQVYEIVEQITK